MDFCKTLPDFDQSMQKALNELGEPKVSESSGALRCAVRDLGVGVMLTTVL